MKDANFLKNLIINKCGRITIITTLVAIYARWDILDSPDAAAERFSVTFCRVCCSLHKDDSYTNRPTDRHCGAAEKIENEEKKCRLCWKAGMNVLFTLHGSRSLRQFSTASLPSFCDSRSRSSITLFSTRLTSRGRHSLFANSNRFRQRAEDIAGTSSVYK